MFQTILIGLFCGLIGVLIGYRLNLGGAASLKRKRFRSDIELLIRKLEGTSISNLAFDPLGFARDTKQFEMNVSDVRPHISQRRIAKFDGACAAYKTTRFSDIGTLEKNAEAENTKAKLVSILNEISGLAA